MRATHEIYKYALAVLLALAGGANVWGQAVTGDRYEDNYVSYWNSSVFWMISVMTRKCLRKMTLALIII